MPFPAIVGVIAGAAVSGLIQAKGAKDVAKEQRKGAEDAQDRIAAAAEEAKAEIIPLFKQAREDAIRGFGASLDVIGQAVPEQLRVFQEGNLAAQEIRLGGIKPFQQAVLGLPTDLSGIQPRGIDVDTSFLENRRVPIKTPTEQEFADLVQAIRLDPIGAEQIFDQIKLDQAQSLETGVSLADIRTPPEVAPPLRNRVGGIRAGTSGRFG